jgi:4-amino-4-deoxy-L-arabinose transferase-like glycosyltransferase
MRLVAIALTCVALAAVLRGVAFGAALPPWQGPDEPAHYTYVERLAEGDLPPLGESQAEFSPAVGASLDETSFEAFRFGDTNRPFTGSAPQARGPSPPRSGAAGAELYPPLYYAAVLPVYALPGLETATARLFALRVASALFAALLVVATFLLVREASRSATLGLAGGALVALPPLVGQASGIANPDVLLAAGTAGLAWSCLRLAGRRRQPRAWLHVGLWLAIVTLAKPIGAALAGIVLVTIAVAPPLFARRQSRVLAIAAVAALTLVALVTAIATGRGGLLRFAVDYFGNFYPPGESRVWTVWVDSGVGGLGWQTVWLPGWALALAVASALAGAAAAGWGAVRNRACAATVAPLVGAIAVYVVVLHAVEVWHMAHGEPPILQGRYLIPAAPLAVAAFLAGAAALPRPAQKVLVGGALGAWTAISVAGLYAVVSYFAT